MRPSPASAGASAGGSGSRSVDADAALFRALHPALRRFAAVCADADIDPDDLVQEALARVLRRGHLGDLDEPAAYLRRTVANLSSNHRRGASRRRAALSRLQVELASDPTYPSDLAELQQLSPADRALLYLVDVERLAVADAAVIVGCSTVAARARASRARRRLRSLLEEPR